MQAGSTRLQDHYFMPKSFRYFFSALFITLGICLLFVALYTGSILVIVFEALFCVSALPYVIYVAAFRKIKVTEEGLFHSTILNPFKPKFIAWENIQQISTPDMYHIIATDTTIFASFTDRIERFETLLNTFRTKDVRIERKKLLIPQPDPSLEDNGFLTSSSNPPRLYQHLGLTMGVLISIVLITLLIVFFALCFVVFGAVNAILSVIWLFMTLWFLDLVLNGFIRIRLEGIDAPKIFGRREIVLWTEIPYAKIFESKIGTASTSTRILKLYVNSKEDFVGYVMEKSPAWEPLLRELKSLNIPIIAETDQFNPQTLTA